jgi:hypothetical protein
VERQHAVFRRAFQAISMDCPDICKEDRLSMALRAVNYMVGPDGISATLLVFGVIPSLGAFGDPQLPTYATRSNALQKATNIATEFNAKKAVHTALANRCAPDIMEIELLKTLPPGSSKRVYREKEGWLQCKLLRVHGHQVEFLLPSGRQSSTTIAAVRAMNAESKTNSLPITLLTSKPNSTLEVNFRFARLRELKGLEERRTFSIFKRDSVRRGAIIYWTTFVDKRKEDGALKSRLCVQAFKDDKHGLFVAAPTMQRSSLRLFCTICAMLSFEEHLRDVSQAFLQSETFCVDKSMKIHRLK